MTGRSLNSIIALLFVHAAGTALAADPLPGDSSFEQANAFLKKYCVSCHGSEHPEADVRLDDLSGDIVKDRLLAERWRNVMHQLQRSEMPPPDATEPGDDERDQIVEWIERQLEQSLTRDRELKGQVAKRRLNRHEYRHTVRDLFGIQGDFDPTTAFPADEEVDGFRNNAAALRTSGYLIEQYFAAAEKVIERAYDEARVSGEPEARTWTCLPHQYTMGSVSNGICVTKTDPSRITMSHGLRSHESDYTGKLFIDPLSQGVPHSGWYDVEIEVAGRHRQHVYGADLMPPYLRRFYPDSKVFFDPDQPLRMSIGQERPGSIQVTRRTAPQYLGTTEIPDDALTTLQFRIWIDQGNAPYLAFSNGPAEGTKMQFVTNLLDKYDATVPKITPEVWANLTKRFERNELYNDRYQGPELHFARVSVSGPIPSEKKSEASRLLFDSIESHAKTVSGDELRAHLCRVAERIFRRPVETLEIEPYAAAIESRMAGNMDYAAAAAPLLKALICSPEFVFLDTAQSNSDESDAWKLSTRLSYFLWSSTSDAELISRARDQTLLQPDVLSVQVQRMLADEKSQRFCQHFTEQWLGLNRLGAMAPGMEEFPDYYLFRLEPAMKEETWRFFQELLNQNLPVTNLVNADFTFANEGLSRLYGLPAVSGDQLRKVTVTADAGRHGLLGHASVLTVTSNGVETSPVVRGVWLLKNLFGTPPSPPPDVPPLEPDVRGATTIRDQLAKHRTVASCNRCHQRIDPLGFALESFDPIGRLRTKYPNGADIDISAEYRGMTMNGARGIQQYFLDHPRHLARHVARMMFTYALGRSLTSADQRDLSQLTSAWEKEGLRLNDLVNLIVASKSFRGR